MTLDRLTPPQRRALKVMANTHTEWAGRTHKRPVLRAEETSDHHGSREVLTIHWRAADSLVAAGYVVVTNDVLRTLELTPEGSALAREAELA